MSLEQWSCGSCKKLATEKAKMKLLESDTEDKNDKEKGEEKEKETDEALELLYASPHPLQRGVTFAG